MDTIQGIYNESMLEALQQRGWGIQKLNKKKMGMEKLRNQWGIRKRETKLKVQ